MNYLRNLLKNSAIGNELRTSIIRKAAMLEREWGLPEPDDFKAFRSMQNGEGGDASAGATGLKKGSRKYVVSEPAAVGKWPTSGRGIGPRLGAEE
mgnify:CR=1 FL=1